jgi:hypothetical protein
VCCEVTDVDPNREAKDTLRAGEYLLSTEYYTKFLVSVLKSS